MAMITRTATSTTRTTADDVRCPWCGGTLTIDTKAIVVDQTPGSFYVPGQPYHDLPRLAPVAFCSGCEFCLEIRP
jgi:hypothetical protein